MSKIQDAIEIMTRIVDGGIDNFHAKDKEKETIHNDNEDDKTNKSCHVAHEEHQQNENQKELKKQKQIEENFKLHDALDCRLLLEEFRKLFAQKPTADYEDNATAIVDKLFQEKSAANKPNAQVGNNNNASNANNGQSNIVKKKIFYGNLKAGKNSNSDEIFNNNCDVSISNKSGIPNTNFQGSNNNKQDDMVFTNYIKSRLENKDPNEICLKHYKKYKSILLAFEETKKFLNNPDSSVASGNTAHNTRSTGYTANFKKSVYGTMNQHQPQQFQFRSNFYNNTAKDFYKDANLPGSGKKQRVNIKTSNAKLGIINSGNNSPDKLRKTGYNFNSSRVNAMSRKIKLLDPQYNFNYQAKYFGVDENLDKNNHKYGNFLLPLLNKKEKNHGNSFIPKTLLMELKQRNEL